MKSIAFMLPGRPWNPVGGYKIVYQYADFFADNGWKVHFFYPYVSHNFFRSRDVSLLKKMKVFLGFYYRKFRQQLYIRNWYHFRNKMEEKLVFFLSPFFCKLNLPYDAIFATSVETAYALNRFRKIPDERKFYFIQDFENWNGNTDEFCYNSYKFPFTKIVISKWLQEKVEQTGNSAVVIPNGLDFDYFKLSVPIEKRIPTEVAMLYHLDDRKRCCDSMTALKIVKEKIPSLHVTMFGAPDKPQDLPDWYSYYKTPSQEIHNSIYNNAAIFIAASMKEGWGLPASESMQCGCALACTNIGGFAEFAINKETALVSPVYDALALANNIIKLIADDKLRIKIASKGYEYVQRFRFERSFKLLMDVVNKN